MGEHRAESQVTVATSPADVRALLADIRGWPDRSPDDRVTVREEITVFEPPSRPRARLDG
jgi:hypothetical protein